MNNISRITSIAILTTLTIISSCGEDPIPEGCIDPGKIDPDAICYINVYRPVCGCDGITYESECFAEIAGVVSWTEGVCED